MRIPTHLLVAVLAIASAASTAHATIRVGPVQGDIEARVRGSATELDVCRRAATPATWRALANVRSIVFAIGTGNAVHDMHFEPASAAADSFRACLAPIVLTWQLGRPETHEAAEIVVQGDELRRIFGEPPRRRTRGR